MIGIRWTIGDVSPRGFEALRLSILGAWRLFGPEAAYAVVVNTVPVDEARRRVGAVPGPVAWRPAGGLPDFLRARLDRDMAEGVAWKLAPLRLFPDRFELSLDNDCILWALPTALRRWLEAGGCVLEEDVRRCLGQFSELCGPRALNTGIRGFPPGFDLGVALRTILEEHPVLLRSELDEQGLQAAALERTGALQVVTVDEVTICSPFHPHQPHLGPCGAHFVGLNVRHLPWSYYDRPAVDCIAEHWERMKPELARRLG